MTGEWMASEGIAQRISSQSSSLGLQSYATVSPPIVAISFTREETRKPPLMLSPTKVTQLFESRSEDAANSLCNVSVDAPNPSISFPGLHLIGWNPTLLLVTWPLNCIRRPERSLLCRASALHSTISFSTVPFTRDEQEQLVEESINVHTTVSNITYWD